VSTFTPEGGPFTPSFVVMSESLGATGGVPDQVTVPEGMGTVVVEGERPQRASYEPFAPSANYQTASLDRPVETETTYLVAVYEPERAGRRRHRLPGGALAGGVRASARRPRGRPPLGGTTSARRRRAVPGDGPGRGRGRVATTGSDALDAGRPVRTGSRSAPDTRNDRWDSSRPASRCRRPGRRPARS
jgi:hypothetical protein